MDDKKITVTTEAGQSLQAEVIDIFNVKGFDDKNYILYSFGETVDTDKEKVYVSILEQINDQFNLKGITDANEWNAVQQAITEAANNATEPIGGV